MNDEKVIIENSNPKTEQLDNNMVLKTVSYGKTRDNEGRFKCLMMELTLNKQFETELNEISFYFSYRRGRTSNKQLL